MDKINKRKRGGNWFEEDKTLLKELVKEKVNEIENKNTDTNTNQRKKKAWLDLEDSFNNMCKGDKRNMSQLKSQWTITKIQAKKEVASHRREVNKTGGGPQPPEKAISANDISVWLPNEFIIDENEFDSDVVQVMSSALVNSSPTNIEFISTDNEVMRDPEKEVETRSIAEVEEEPKKTKETVHDKVNNKRKKTPVLTQDVASNEIVKLSDIEVKCREEVHQLQIENERKKARNLDLEYELLQEKIKFFRMKMDDCMHVVSEAGDYAFKKQPARASLFVNNNEDSETAAALLQLEDSLQVCGLYIVGEPDTIVEITMKHYDVNCESGGLMAFVDGWELNGEYFPSIKDHHRPLEERVQEFCNNYKHWPRLTNKKFFRSSQNAALLQYRLPLKGSFIANVRFHKITQPCNILVQDIDALYHMANYGHNRNCSISALFPAVVSVANLKIGGKTVRQDKPNYDCGLFADRLEIGGSSGLDSTAMEKSSDICGFSNEPGHEQAIFCGVTTIRLLSTGRFQNQASIMIRKAEEHDLDIATLICAL